MAVGSQFPGHSITAGSAFEYFTSAAGRQILFPVIQHRNGIFIQKLPVKLVMPGFMTVFSEGCAALQKTLRIIYMTFIISGIQIIIFAVQLDDVPAVVISCDHAAVDPGLQHHPVDQ